MGLELMTKTLLAALAALGIMMRPPRPPSFGDDLAFLEKHARVVLLGRGDAQVAVCPAYQGRVMTSTASAAAGPSLGWIHREHIASGSSCRTSTSSAARTGSGSARRADSSRS